MNEYRDPELAKQYLEEIKNTVTQNWSIMEVCGGQTHSLVKNGTMDMLGKTDKVYHYGRVKVNQSRRTKLSIAGRMKVSH